MTPEDVRRLLIEGYGYAPDVGFIFKGKRKVYVQGSCPGEVKGEGGVYFGKVESDGIRLTIEGSFLVGPKATKNVIEISWKDTKRWLSGEDISVEFEGNAWVILHHGPYWLGGGKAVNGVVKNYVPKDRRLNPSKV